MKFQIIYINSKLQKWLLFLFFTFCVSFVHAQAPNINRIEYYVDDDPGYGKATNLSFTGTNDVAATINLNLTPIASGVHIVGVRSRDVHGAWSLDNEFVFLKPYPGGGAVVQPNINRVEWYLDNDPGYGNGTPITITAGQNLSGLAINLNLTPLSSGVHLVGIRSRDANGAWSIDNEFDFTGGTGVAVPTWVGTISSAWTNTGNWSTGKVPIATDSVVIASGTPFPPIISSGVTGTCKSILVKSGATVTIALGGALKVGP